VVLVLTDFKETRPLYESDQTPVLEWLTQAYLTAREKRFGVSAEGIHARERIEKLLNRYGCKAPRVLRRGHEIADFQHTRWAEMEIYRLSENPHGVALGHRMQVFAKGALRGFKALYQDAAHPAPGEVIHVTCTGYSSPSPAQLFVESRGWGRNTKITPLYHSGCYAAVPAVRLGVAAASVAPAAGSTHPSVDIVHTELCSLHLDPLAQEPDQLVVHTLFADGFIRYSVRPWDRATPGLRVLAVHEEIVPNTPHEMQWLLEPYSFRMALTRQVPELLAQVIEPFLEKLTHRAGLLPPDLRGATHALHPGGPRIIEVLQDKLRLDDKQIVHSRKVLAEKGNMSSATLPTIWSAILNDPSIPHGALIPSVAFGPGLTIAGVLLQKVLRQ
jgi:predicted naringenin-chalcone synthase